MSVSSTSSAISVEGHNYGVGLIETLWRVDRDQQPALRKAGDSAFAFAFFAFLAQIYVLIAVTLRFLGRTDSCSGRLPHSLKVRGCVVVDRLGCGSGGGPAKSEVWWLTDYVH